MSWRKKKPENFTRAERVMAFLETYCLTPEGANVGKPIVLAEFQQRFIRDIYDNPKTTRRAILTLARKNGKTALLAGLMLCHILGSEAVQNSQIISGAMSRDQAALVFSLAEKMLMMQPAFEGLYRVVPSGKKIYGLVRNVEYRALSADGSTAHGLSPILAILDEVGQVRGPMTPFIEAIVTSQGAHENPMLMFISTQAPSDADFLSTQIDDAIRSGDPHTVCHIYAAEEGCDLMDKEQWKKANPALGVFRSEKDLEEQIKQAARIPSMEASVRNLLLNQRIALDSLWLAPAVWKSCAGEIDIDAFRGMHHVSLGLDLSMRTDLTAAVLSTRDDNGVIHLLPFVFAPSQGMKDRELRDKAPYTAWERDGQLFAVPGATLDYEWLCEWLKAKLDDLGIEINSIQFDRWRIKEFRSAAERTGFALDAEWLEIGQGYQSMSPRIEAFETYMLQGKMRHGAHPLLNMAAANAIVVRDAANNRKLDKSKSTLRIDPIVAAVMAVGAFMEQEAEFDVGAFIG
jgi:phage terminase large subunit-like protein